MSLTVKPVGAGAGLKASDRSHEAAKPQGKDFGVELAEAIIRIGRNAEDLKRMEKKGREGWFA